MIFLRLLFILVVFSNFCSAQQTLEIYFTRLGALKKYTFHSGEIFQYKVKGEHKFRKAVIENLNDSIIYFSNDQGVFLSDLKCVRFQKKNHLFNLFGSAFMIAGIGFVSLNTFNSLILNKPEIINKNAVIASACLVAGSLILKRMGYKKIRLTKRKTIKIVDLNFKNLNSPNN